MDKDQTLVELTARRFTLYSLRIFPLWEGDSESIALGSDLQSIIGRIIRERSVGHFLGREPRPMRFCQLEQEEAIYLIDAQKTYFEKRQTPVWKVMVPASGVYSRETIMSCMARGTGRNIEKYESVLFQYPKAVEFYTYSVSEIRPVDEAVFVIEHQTR